MMARLHEKCEAVPGQAANPVVGCLAQGQDGVFKLPKAFLIRKGYEFQRIYEQGKRWRGSGFTLIVVDRNDLEHSRIGISVHRQIKGAVPRNRIKRIIRESFRLRPDLYPPSADIIFAVRPDMGCDSTLAINQAVSLCRR